MDICRWGLGKTGLPKIVYSSGGKFIYDNDQETPNTQQAIFDYGDSQIVFEVRGLVTGSETGIGEDEGNHIGNIFLGSDGYMALDVNGFTIWRGEKREPGERMKYQEPVEWEPRRTSPNSWPPCAAASTPTSRVISRRGTCRPRCATWRTSAIGWGGAGIRPVG